MRSELDWVVMKALEKDRTRRYDTPTSFAADVRRYLAGEAVQAHPPSVAYKLRKFLRKNRGPVAAASLVAAALVAGVVGTSVGQYRAEQARALAETRREQAEAAEALAETRLGEAVTMRERAMATLRATTGDDVEKLIGSRKELGPNERAYLEAIIARWEDFVKTDSDSPEGRSVAAEGAFRVAVLRKKLGERDAAIAGFRRALALQERLAADFPAVPEYRSDLAKSRTNLGVLLSGQGKAADAEAEYRGAAAIQERLAADFPAVPEYRSDLAKSRNNLGNLLSGQGKAADAEAEYRAAATIREKLAADFPVVTEYRVSLGGSYCNFGNLLRNNKSAESLLWYDKAFATLTLVVQQQPDDATASLYLRNSHGGRAKAYDGLKRHTEAVADWTRAIKLSPAKDQPMVRASRANSRVQAGQYAEAVAEVAELAKSDAWDVWQWYDFACVYAVASGKVAGKREEYAGRAVELLRKSIAKGFKDSGHMANDSDLDPLRGRAEFRELVAELEAKHPRPPELAPPPRPAK